MELRQLQAFEAVATDLHFGRAAKRLFTSQPAISEQIQRLERELGTPLFHRTSRRVELTPAGVELLARTRRILAEVQAAEDVVRAMRDGTGRTLALGVTPPAAPVLAPHLRAAFAEGSPQVSVDLHQMWLPSLVAAVDDGRIDVAVTPPSEDVPAGMEMELLAKEPLLAGLRPSHRLADRSQVPLEELAHEVLGWPPEELFPAWAQSLRHVMKGSRAEPPTAPLFAADISALGWSDQAEVDWVLLTPSLAMRHEETKFVALSPPQYVEFAVLWRTQRATDPVLARFLESCRTVELPVGWLRV